MSIASRSQPAAAGMAADARSAPPQHSRGVDRLSRGGATLALLLCAAYGLEGLAPASFTLSGWPAHELHGALALALLLTAAVDALPQQPRLLALLQAAAGVMLLLAAALLLIDLGDAPPGAVGPRLGPLSGAGLVLALAILAASLWPLRAPLPATAAVAVQLLLALLWGVCAAALGTLLPARLLLDWLPLDAGLSWPATLVLVLLAQAATLRVYRQPALRARFRDREDRRILASVLAMLFGAIGVAAMLVAGLLTVQVVEAVQPVLQHQAAQQALALGGLVERIASAADRVAASDAPLQAERLRELRQQLDPFGQVGIRLQGPGRPVLTEGTFHDAPWPQLALAGSPGMAILMPNGLVLQAQRTLQQPPGTQLTIQVRPFEAEAQLLPTELLGARAEVLLCADAGDALARCLSRTRPAGLVMPLPARDDGQPWPIQRAWRGEQGALLVRDPARVAALVAFAPVAGSGLGVAHKLMLAPLAARLTTRVPATLLTLLAVGAAVAIGLYRRAFPRLRALRYAKAQMQATLEHLPRGVLTLDSQHRVATSNAALHALSGRDAAALRGRPIDSLLGLADGTPWQPQPGTGEALLHAVDGTRIPVEILVEGFLFEGRPRSLLIVRDLRREIARRAELERWERIFWHADWGVAASGDGMRLELMNPAFARMHGWSVDELKQRPVLEVFAPQARAELPAHIERIHALGHHRFESLHQRRDGSVFPVLIDASLVHGADGRDFRVVNVQDISEQKRSQEAVQRSEGLLQLVLRALPVGVWIADREGRVVATNPAVERFWGGPVELHQGRPPPRRARHVGNGQPLADDDDPIQRALRTGRATLSELIEVEGADGQWRTMMNAVVPLVGGDGAIEGAIAVNEDLTTLRRAEAAIVAAKNVFESLFQSAALGIAVWNAEGRFERVNPALCELLDRDEQTLLSLSLADVAEPGTLEADLTALGRMRQGEPDKLAFERRWRRGDGSSLWVLVSVSLVRLPDAEHAQFVVQVLDIERSRRFQQALQASETRLLNAQRIARLADWEWDAQRDELRLSEAGRRMLELPAGHPGVLVGAQWLARVHDDDRGAVAEAFAAALQGRRALAIDYRLRLDEGGERCLHQQGERSADDPQRLVGILQDITDRKRAENELLQSRQRLRDLSANQEALIENERRHIAREVHDELGQALTALKLELSLLARRLGGEPALAAQAERMATMVDGTLDVVRHVASNLRPAALDFGLVAAIEWLAEDFGLRWEMACEVHHEGPEAVLGNTRSTALFRIVQESLTNVARHAHAQRVEIRIVGRPDLLCLSVHDDGVGFDPAAAQERGGHFGLLGMRERALAIGGRLRVDSRPGGGTTIAVELPLTDTPET